MDEITKTTIRIINGDAWQLAGSYWKKVRQAIIFDLTGINPTLAKSGCVALENLLAQKAQIDTSGKCYAEILKDLKAWSETL